jgi:hypothetical protein
MLCILGGREIWYRQFANCDISVPSSLLRRTIEKSVRYHRHINTLVRFACSPRKRKMFDSTIFETIAVDHQTPLSENLPSNEEEWQQFRKDIYDRHDLEEVITTPMAATQEAAAAPETLPAAPTVTATAVVTETVELPTGRVVEDKRTIMPPSVDTPTVVPVMGFRRPSATTYDSKTEKAVIDRLLTMKQLTVHCECALISLFTAIRHFRHSLTSVCRSCLVSLATCGFRLTTNMRILGATIPKDPTKNGVWDGRRHCLMRRRRLKSMMSWSTWLKRSSVRRKKRWARRGREFDLLMVRIRADRTQFTSSSQETSPRRKK